MRFFFFELWLSLAFKALMGINPIFLVLKKIFQLFPMIYFVFAKAHYSEITANICCNCVQMYWECCVICSIFLRNIWNAQYEDFKINEKEKEIPRSQKLQQLDQFDAALCNYRPCFYINKGIINSLTHGWGRTAPAHGFKKIFRLSMTENSWPFLTFCCGCLIVA